MRDRNFNYFCKHTVVYGPTCETGKLYFCKLYRSIGTNVILFLWYICNSCALELLWFTNSSMFVLHWTTKITIISSILFPFPARLSIFINVYRIRRWAHEPYSSALGHISDLIGSLMVCLISFPYWCYFDFSKLKSSSSWITRILHLLFMWLYKLFNPVNVYVFCSKSFSDFTFSILISICLVQQVWSKPSACNLVFTFHTNSGRKYC